MEDKDNIINQKKRLEISMKLNKYEFFPSDTIEGNISIVPNSEILNNKELENINILFSLVQKIFYDVKEFNFAENNMEIKKDFKSSILIQKTINYANLKEFEIGEGYNIPFQISLLPLQSETSMPSSNKNDNSNFYYSFRYISPDIKCMINYSLSIEICGESNKCSQNIFIKKIPNKILDKNINKENEIKIFKEDVVKKLKYFKAGKLNYFIKIKKHIKYNEDIPLEIHLDETELNNLKVKSITFSLKKYITIKNCYKSYENTICKKKTLLLNPDKNKTINELIQVDKNEFNKIPNEELQKNFKKIIKECENNNLINNIMKYNFTPPIENEYFKCNYLLKVVFDLDSTLAGEKYLVIPIDFYDEDYDILNINNDNNDNNNDNNNNDINNINIKNENNINQNNINNENNLKNDICDDFTIIETEDFMDMIDGKKKLNEIKDTTSK